MGSRIYRRLNKSKIIRLKIKQYEIKKIVLKFISLVSLKLKYKFNNNYLKTLYYFQHYGKKSSISSIKNLCLETGRARGVFSFFKLSRFKLKEFGNMGLIPGLRRSS
jgi:ribosomal protein S14